MADQEQWVPDVNPGYCVGFRREPKEAGKKSYVEVFLKAEDGTLYRAALFNSESKNGKAYLSGPFEPYKASGRSAGARATAPASNNAPDPFEGL